MNDLDEQTGEQLRRHLDMLTAPVTADDAVPVRVVTGGQGRLVARRRRRAAGAIVTALLVTAFFVAPSELRGPLVLSKDDGSAADAPADPPAWLTPFVDGPPRGDLVDDAAYRTSVLETWSRALRDPSQQDDWFNGVFAGFRKEAGPAHVAWAQRSPAGPAALVVQEVVTGNLEAMPDDGGSDDDLPSIRVWIAGFVGVDEAGKPRIAGIADPQARRSAWYVDPAHRTLALLDMGRPLRWSLGSDYTGGEITARPARHVDLRRGWAFLDVPASTDPWAVQVFEDDGRPVLANENPRYWHDTGLSTDDPIRSPIVGLTPVDHDSIARFADQAREFVVDAPFSGGVNSSPVLALGRLPNGHAAVLFVARFELERPQLYLGEQTARGLRRHHVGPVPLGRDDPLRFPLPDDSGSVWVVVGGTLRYQAADGTWSEPAPNALFVPKDARDVRTTPKG